MFNSLGLLAMEFLFLPSFTCTFLLPLPYITFLVFYFFGYLQKSARNLHFSLIYRAELPILHFCNLN